MKGIVTRILPFSSVDGPGNRSVVFLQGCNFDCLFCHNPETIPLLKAPLAQEKKDKDHVREMDVAQVIDQLDKVRAFTSGVTISGGECTVQFDFLLDLVKGLKDKGYEVFIDTNGNVSKEKFIRLMAYVDQFMIDLKSIHEEEHRALTGATNKRVLESMELAAQAGKLFEIRTVVIPDVLDNMRTVVGGAKFIAEHNPDIRYKIIKYRQHGVRPDMLESRSPTDEEMKALYEVAKNIGCRNIVII